MEYGDRELQKGAKGLDVRELQIRLAGFRGTVPDGDFGPGTELQVVSFQKDYMELAHPSGIVNSDTMNAIDEFARRHTFDFTVLACNCGECGGFGQGKYKGKYRSGMSRHERYYRYEYPGIHRMLLWSVRALFFYLPEYQFSVTSGYRCSVNNKQHNRSSTNHHGKAIDLDVLLQAGEDKRDDMRRCNKIRGLLVERANAQIGWWGRNRKSLEPENIAPTWLHYDVRSYDRKYLRSDYFCSDLQSLDRSLPVEL